MRRLWVAGIALGGLLLGVGLLWLGYGLYVRFVVSASPSTQAVVRGEAGEFRLGQYTGGDQVVLAGAESPTPSPALSLSSPTPSAAESAQPSAPSPTTAPPAVASPTSTSRPILPPTELKIPKIGLDASVVLSDNENLPEFRGVGWLLGSGYPGFRGNVVLFGHLNGKNETFARLHELVSGDEIQVVADDRAYRYQVRDKRTVPRQAVEVLAPTSDYRLTLITCTGTFFPQTRDYSHRLVVTAIQR